MIIRMRGLPYDCPAKQVVSFIEKEIECKVDNVLILRKTRYNNCCFFHRRFRLLSPKLCLLVQNKHRHDHLRLQKSKVFDKSRGVTRIFIRLHPLF